MATDVVSETDTREQPRHRHLAPANSDSPRSLGPSPKWTLMMLAIAAVLIAVWFFRPTPPTTDGIKLTHTVGRTELPVSVTEEGVLESSQNKDIKCTVAGGSTILWIIEDGTEVKSGDLLVKLDASTIEDQIRQQRITYEKALATHIQSESDLAVAEINVKEYLEGTYRKELQTAQSNVAISEENLRVAQNIFDHTQKMYHKGYVSRLELDGKQYGVQHATLQLSLMKTAVDVLQRFTKPKMLQDLESKKRAAAAKLASEEAALELEKQRLVKLEEQKEGCTIYADRSGMVIYPETEEWREEPAIEEGSKVREQQTILQLPNVKKMQVKLEIHESKIDQLKSGMPARVRIQDREYSGELVSVANRAEQTSWWRGNVRKFKSIVKINDQTGLKPGMSAEVEIMVARHRDVLTVPVAAVVENDRDFHCWVKVGNDVQRRSLLLGDSNQQFVVVKDGVLEGDRVILNPRAVVPEEKEEALKPVSKPAAEDAKQTLAQTTN